MINIEKQFTQDKIIGVVGLGYVGLPLLLGYASKGFKVVGFDVDEKKIVALKNGQSYIEHVSSEPIKHALHLKLLNATNDFTLISGVDAIIICVPTPLDKHYEPDLSYVIDTVESILPHMRKGQVISLESTTYPGTTEEELRSRLEACGFKVGEDIFLLYSPEREDPGNPHFAGLNIPKVVGGSTEACLKTGLSLYGAVFDQVVPVRSTKVAEFAKLLENIYRAVNIGLVNELKIAADAMGINIWEVIDAAATKPFGFKAFYPGPGLGGHCIPIDPFYLTWKAKEYGVHTRFIELAGEINRAMPNYVVQKVMTALNRFQKSVKGSKILIMGISYKENVDDMRESPSFAIMDGLDQMGAHVDYYDPHVPIIGPTREHMNWAGKKSIEWSQASVSDYDCTVISTNHRCYDLSKLGEWSTLIVDTRNAMKEITSGDAVVVMA